jgi:hypothetical protein
MTDDARHALVACACASAFAKQSAVRCNPSWDKFDAGARTSLHKHLRQSRAGIWELDALTRQGNTKYDRLFVKEKLRAEQLTRDDLVVTIVVTILYLQNNDV